MYNSSTVSNVSVKFVNKFALKKSGYRKKKKIIIIIIIIIVIII